jgi:hypothetical protein
MAVGALLQITLVDMATIVADRIGDIKGEIVTAFIGRYFQQMGILLLRQMLLEIHVKGGTACKMFNIRCTMKFELVNNGQRVILHNIEITIITVTWYEITVLTIPLGMLYTDILSRNHLTIERSVQGFPEQNADNHH